MNCNGSIVADEEFGAVLTLQGDKRKEIADFLIHEGIADKEMVRVHGT
jgi:translation initiation factor 1